MERFDTDNDGVITFDEYIIPYGLEIDDEDETVQLQLQVERRAFDKRDRNLNGALEGLIIKLSSQSVCRPIITSGSFLVI